MPYDIPKTVSKIYIHTGNVLNANELTQKAGQNATEEVTVIIQFVFRFLNFITLLFNSYHLPTYMVLGS